MSLNNIKQILINLSGTLGSVLLSRFGVLKTGLFSAVVGPVGCIAASLAPSVPVLIFCVGVITGEVA